MNYLAHIILSGHNLDLMYGNFISDAVKGNSFLNFSGDVRKGILLHRHIDHFTDTHPKFLKSKRRFYGKIDKLSGVVTDVLYDYLLWKNWNLHYSKSPLLYIDQAYHFLDKKKEQMPNKIGKMYHYMRKFDWLNAYHEFSGIQKAIIGISNRTGISLDVKLFSEIYCINESAFNDEFNAFYYAILTSVDDFHNQY